MRQIKCMICFNLLNPFNLKSILQNNSKKSFKYNFSLNKIFITLTYNSLTIKIEHKINNLSSKDITLGTITVQCKNDFMILNLRFILPKYHCPADVQKKLVSAPRFHSLKSRFRQNIAIKCIIKLCLKKKRIKSKCY